MALSGVNSLDTSPVGLKIRDIIIPKGDIMTDQFLTEHRQC